MSNTSIITGEAALHNLVSSSSKYISTGIRKLDLLLDGGLWECEIVEFYGKSNCCKTQLCHKIIESISCHSETSPSSLYIDLHNDFSASRLLQFCKHQNPNLDNVRVIKKVTIDGILRTLEEVQKELCHGQSPFFEKLRLIVIDALPFALYTVMDWKNPGRQIQEQLIRSLRKISSIYKLTFIIINHGVTFRIDQSGSVIGKSFGSGGGSSLSKYTKNIKPALGIYWSHIPNTRILLSRGDEDGFDLKDNKFRATVVKSGHDQINRYTDFLITANDIF